MVGFFTFMLVTGIAVMIFGLVVLVDWRGLGARNFHWTVQLPGWRLYEEWGARYFRIHVGVGAILGGLMGAIVAAVNLA